MKLEIYSTGGATNIPIFQISFTVSDLVRYLTPRIYSDFTVLNGKGSFGSLGGSFSFMNSRSQTGGDRPLETSTAKLVSGVLLQSQ